eukprot:428523_1
MGTRGIHAFYFKGKLYVVYNQFDSYYDGLGNDLLSELRAALEIDPELKNWIALILQLKPTVYEPTPEDIQNLKQYTDLTVSNQSEQDWYCLLRKCQGSFIKVLNSGYIQDGILTQHFNDLKFDDWGAEYGYILNLDDWTFEYKSMYNDIKLFDQKNSWHSIKLTDINMFSNWPNELTQDEQMEQALKYKVYGNQLFKEKKYNKAIFNYEMSLKWIEFDDNNTTEIFTSEFIRVNNNLCLVYLKLKNWSLSIKYSSKVLGIDGNNLKALIRRGEAKFNLLSFDEAKIDLTQAKSLNKNVATGVYITKLLKKTTIKQKEYETKQHRMYAKMFEYDQKDKETV